MAEITYELTEQQQNIILNRIVRNADKIAEEVNQKLVKYVYNKANEICKSAVDSFYSDYEPKLYKKRKGSLYTAYDIRIINGSQLKFTLGDEFMKGKHRVSNTYIYDTMFKEGWHGGAHKGNGHPNPGDHYWRTPPSPRMMYIEEYDEMAYVRPWTFWYHRPANRSVSPYDEIKKNWEDFVEGEGKEKLRKTLDNVLDDYF